MLTLLSLPDDLLALCLSDVGAQAIGRLAACSRRLRRTALSDALWRPLMLSAVASRQRRGLSTVSTHGRCRTVYRNVMLVEARDRRWKLVKAGELASRYLQSAQRMVEEHERDIGLLERTLKRRREERQGPPWRLTHVTLPVARFSVDLDSCVRDIPILRDRLANLRGLHVQACAIRCSRQRDCDRMQARVEAVEHECRLLLRAGRYLPTRA